jgi:Leucine-rich repeat (LRR) protein
MDSVFISNFFTFKEEIKMKKIMTVIATVVLLVFGGIICPYAHAEPPVITISAYDVMYVEGKLYLDKNQDVSVTDSDSPDFDGGSLTVQIGGLVSTEDVLAISEAEDIAVPPDSNEVLYGGVMIGMFSFDSEAGRLDVSFNENASAASVSALIQGITYENTNTVNPTKDDRAISFILNDGDSEENGNSYMRVFFAANIPSEERQALIDFYNSTGGDNWHSERDNWLDEPGTECIWYGITCDAEKNHIIEIGLPNAGLTGTLPASLTNLSRLDTLYLGSKMFENQLSGSIPAFLGSISSLRVLYLPRSQLTGSIPPELGNLSNLEFLSLEINQLTGEIPAELANLSGLEELSLGYNQLSGSIPSELGNPSRINGILDLSNNQLTGTVPPELGNLENLYVLDLSNNQLSGTIPPELGKLANLRDIGLNDNQLTGPVPSELMELTNLTDGESDFCNNALYTSDDALRDFLNTKQKGGDWESCQRDSDSPPVAHDGTLTVNEGTTGRGTLQAEGTSLTYYIVDKPKYGDVTITDPETGAYEYTPAASSGLDPCWWPGACDSTSGTDTFTFKVNDGIADSNIAGITVTVLKEARHTITLAVTPEEGGTIIALDDAVTDGEGNILVRDGENQRVRISPAEGWEIAQVVIDENDLTDEFDDTNRYVFTEVVSDHFMGVTFIKSAAGIPPEERQALIDLYNYTDGDNWIDNTNWLGEPGTECSWFGITCDEENTHVVKIDLSGNQLTGSIPAELGDISNLVYLFLSNNQLTGSIPAELGNLSNLQTLSLGSNQLTGSIPAELASLSNLQQLELSRNQLTGSIPAELGNLSNLHNVELGQNELTGSIPAELGNLSNLKFLSLVGNELTGSIPAELGNLYNLEFLSLAGNRLTGSIPVALANLSNLVTLYLGLNELTGGIPAELGNLSNLLTLDLSYTPLTGSIPAELGNLSNLQRLDLAFTQLTGSIPPELGNLSNLKDLYLGYSNLTGNIPAELGNLSNLQSLLLSRSKLTGSIPAELGNLSNLKYLYLGYNQLTGSIPPELGNLSNLWDLDLGYNALYTSNLELLDFLNSLNDGWENTQTVAPANLEAVEATETSISLTWEPILYTNDSGGYEVYYALDPFGDYTLFDTTPDKTVNSMIVTGLEPGTEYYFRVRTVTYPHTYNQNTVYSEYTAEISAATPVLHYTIIAVATPEDGGTVIPSGEISLDSGANQTFTIEPADGYTTQDVIIDDESVGAVPEYSFENVAADHSLYASFEPIPQYTIAATSEGNGTISPPGIILINQGESQTYTIQPDEGYEIADLLADSVSVKQDMAQDSTYIFPDISGNHLIHVIFEKTSLFSARWEPAEWGEIIIRDGIAIIDSAPGYAIEDVQAAGDSIGSVPTHQFPAYCSDDTADIKDPDACSIYAAFMEAPITATAGENGIVTVTVAADQGLRTWVVSMIPDPGYMVDQVMADGISAGAVIRYTFPDDRIAHTLHATFTEGIPHTITADAGENGSIFPAGPVAVKQGENMAFGFMPNFGYTVENVWVDGNPLGATSAYTFRNVVSDHTISVSFVPSVIPRDEREVLADLYNSTQGENWNTHSNWLGFSGTECTWYGVICNDAGGEVIELDLNANNLAGSLPWSLQNLTHLADNQSDFRWNAVYTSDAALREFLNSKQSGGDWESTQTLAPSDVTTAEITEDAVSLSWTAISYTGDSGGYEIWYAEESGGEYSLYGITPDKRTEQFTVKDLNPDTAYDFKLRTVTEPHANNDSAVYSDYTAAVSAKTSVLSPLDTDEDADGYTENDGDCNDADPNIYPEASEICGDGIDQDCDGKDFPCPDAEDQSVTMLQNTSAEITLAASGADDLTYTISSQPDHGTLTGEPPRVIYTPEADYHGTDRFEFTVYDGYQSSSPAAVSIAIEQNLPPEKPEPLSPENESSVSADGVTLEAGAFSDPDGDAHAKTHWQMRRAGSPYLCSDCGYDDSFHYTADSGTLTEHRVSGLVQDTKYIWRVQYEDARGGRSPWSEERTFKTGTASETVSMNIAAGKVPADFQMISFGVWPENPGSTAVFGDVVKDRYGEIFRIATYDPHHADAEKDGYHYAEYGPDLKIEPGRAYWFFTLRDAKITVKGMPVRTDHPFEVELLFNPDRNDGWNMIACPNDADYQWGDLEVVRYEADGSIADGYPKTVAELESDDCIDKWLWRWENGGYQSDTSTLRKQQGYWVKANMANVFLKFPAKAQQSPSDQETKTSPAARQADAPGYSPPAPISFGSQDNSSGGGTACFISASAGGSSSPSELIKVITWAVMLLLILAAAAVSFEKRGQ